MSASRRSDTSDHRSTGRRLMSPGATLAVLLVGLAGFVALPLFAASDASQDHVSPTTIAVVLETTVGVGVAIVVTYVYFVPLWRTGHPRPARAPRWKAPSMAVLPATVAAIELSAGPTLVALPIAGLLAGLAVSATLIALVRTIRAIASNTWPIPDRPSHARNSARGEVDGAAASGAQCE